MIQTVNAGQVNRDLNYFERQYQYHYYYPSPGNQPREKQILPLDFLQCLQARLREKYTQYDQLERLFDERKTPIVDSFINLALIKETEHKEKEKGLGFNTSQAGKDKKVFVDERMASHEELYAPKEPLALNQLFEPKNDTKAPNKVLILGRAGIGKSVLCQYLAVQWASESKDEEQKQGEIGNYFRQKFDAVFWVRLREVADFLSPSDIDKNITGMNVLGYVIHKCCFMLSENQSPEAIETFIKSNKNKILFILDGYDEITERVTQSRHLNDFLDRIKNQTYVLMTSRPLAIDALGQSKITFDRKLENIGFINKNIEAYVHHFMRWAEKPDQTNPMLKFLRTHPSIWGIAHIPINLELLSWLWSEGDLELVKGEIKTLSKLYKTIVDRVQDAYVRKSNPLYAKSLDASVESKEEEPFFSNLVNEFLEYLAYESMQQESLLIGKNQLRKALGETLKNHRKPNNLRSQETLLKSATDKLGFLKTTGEGGRSQLDQKHYFIHLSFQEFYAASYITRILSSPIENEEKMGVIQAIMTEKYTPRYQLMLWMTAGLCYQQGVEKKRVFTALEPFWKAILSEPRDRIGFHHLVLVMHCLDECEADDRLPLHQLLIDEQMRWFDAYARKSGSYFYRTWNKCLDQLADCPSLQGSERVVNHFLKNLDNKNKRAGQYKQIMLKAIQALGRLSNPSEAVVALLLNVLKNESKVGRWSAMETLGYLSNPNKAVLAALLNGSIDENERVRRSAMGALGRLSNPSEAVVEALLNGSIDENKRVRQSAIRALGQLSNLSEAVVAALLNGLKDENEGVRRSAREALSHLSNPSEAVIALLLNGLKDENEWVRQSAMRALNQLSHSSEAVVHTLLEVLEKDNPIVQIGDKINDAFTEIFSHFKKNHIAIFFERFLHHPFLIVYLSSYFQENHVLCIDHKNKQLILSLYNKAYKISFSQENLIHLEKQVRSIAEQLHYPLNILLNDNADEEQPAANSIAEAGLNDALVQTQSHCESKADPDCPEEKDTLLEEPKNAKTAQSEHVKGRLFNQGQNGRMSTVESIDHKNLQTLSISSNVYSYWNNKKPQPFLGFGVKSLEQLLWNSSFSSNLVGRIESSSSAVQEEAVTAASAETLLPAVLN